MSAFDVLGPDTPVGNCARPNHLPLVDKAFDQPGGPEARQMIRTLCRHCPAAVRCLAHAMTHREHGVWGGTTPKFRTLRGAPGSTSTKTNRRAS